MLALLLCLLPFILGAVLIIKQLLSQNVSENINSETPPQTPTFNWLIGSSFILIWFLSISSYFQTTQTNTINLSWLPILGSSFHLELAGFSRLMVLLSTTVSLLIYYFSYKHIQHKNNQFWGLYFLSLTGLIGLFCTKDLLVFYFFWELVLIPIYFLNALFGKSDKQIFITSKLFIYTFLGSVLMLVGILSIENALAFPDYSYDGLIAQTAIISKQKIAFWLIFIGMAVKVPMFPFHSWQPDAYSQAPLPIATFMSSLMAKMGLFGIIVWLVPMFSLSLNDFRSTIIFVAIIGALYAGLIAFKQTTIKRWIAFCSMAHLGIMVAACFAGNIYADSGVKMQLFNHGLNVLGLWLLAYIFEYHFKIQEIDKIKGLARLFPKLTVFIFINLLANIALPLTNSFNAEFLMLNGIFTVSKLAALLGVLTVITTAIYVLHFAQKSIWGSPDLNIENQPRLDCNYYIVYILLGVFVFLSGVFPMYQLWHLL